MNCRNLGVLKETLIKELLGHEQIETAMKYLDITVEDEVRALATTEGENSKNISKKWKFEINTHKIMF